MYVRSGYDDAAVKDICYHCGSPTAKKSYNYFRRIAYVSGGKVWAKVWAKVWYAQDLPVAFYYATRARDHVRLIEIAVREDFQGTGLGKEVLNVLLRDMQAAGIRKLTFRTPSNETAPGFWLHMGARIMDVKGQDYEMELTLN